MEHVFKCKYLSFLILFLLNISILQAQSEKKLEKLVSKSKFEKLIEKSMKRIKKGNYDAVSYYYLTKGYLEMAVITTGKTQERNYYYATKQYKKCEKLSDSTSICSLLKPLILELGHSYTDSTSKLKKGKQKYYAKFLATYFLDTTAAYVNHYITPKQEIKTEILISNADSIDYSNLAQVMKKDKGISYKVPELLPPGTDIVVSAEKALGTPWIWAGTTPGKGFDCSGFVTWAYSEFGFELPHRTKLLAEIGTPVHPGSITESDIVCFGSSNYSPKNVFHVGLVYSVDNEEIQMIHCGTSIGVSIVPLSSGYWSGVDHFFIRIKD